MGQNGAARILKKARMDEGRIEEEGEKVEEEEEGRQYEGHKVVEEEGVVGAGEESGDWQMKGNFRVSVV